MAKQPEIKHYGFIIEGTHVTANNQIEILEEQRATDGRMKVCAKATLQEVEQKNANGRVYPMNICESIVTQLSPKAASRSLLMEIDHPLFVSADPNILKKRAAIVEINNCGALLRQIYINDKQVCGIFETLSGFKGPDLYNLIMKDKVDVGFSLRALGAVEALSDGTIMVKEPIRPITYDIVSNPSHTNAKVLEFLPESASEFLADNIYETIFEHVDMNVLNIDKITIMDGNQVITRFIDDIINEKFCDIVSKKIKFNF